MEIDAHSKPIPWAVALYVGKWTKYTGWSMEQINRDLESSLFVTYQTFIGSAPFRCINSFVGRRANPRESSPLLNISRLLELGRE